MSDGIQIGDVNDAVENRSAGSPNAKDGKAELSKRL